MSLLQTLVVPGVHRVPQHVQVGLFDVTSYPLQDDEGEDAWASEVDGSVSTELEPTNAYDDWAFSL